MHVIGKHKIVLGDSHARRCASKLQDKLQDWYVKPGVGATILTETARRKQDV
jgi:hypothetical protein